MSTEQTWQTDSTSLEDTLALGENLGSKLKGGEIIELVGDLGSGKTTFVKGIANGIGSIELVTSPSFTTSNVYKTDNLQIHHYDFYRLNEPGLSINELLELGTDPNRVVIIEWAQIVQRELPADRLVINIKAQAESQRSFVFQCSPRLLYLIPSDSTDI